MAGSVNTCLTIQKNVKTTAEVQLLSYKGINKWLLILTIICTHFDNQQNNFLKLYS